MKLYEFRPSDAERFALERGIRANAHGDELQFARCPYCGKKEGYFSINLKTGAFNCKRASCGAKGNMLTLHRDFGFDLGKDVAEYERPRFEWKRFENLSKVRIAPTDPAVRYLTGRGIPEEVTRRYEVTTKKGDPNILVFPFRAPDDEVEYIKYRKINFEKSKDKSKEWSEGGMRPILFGMKQCEGDDRLILTEGQIDSMSVAAAGIKNACSVPNGKDGMTWIPHCWDWLKRFKQIVVFGDYERGSMTLLEDVRARFGCAVRAVRPEDYKGCKDANEILQRFGPEAVRQAVENAQPAAMPQVLDLSDVRYEDATNDERMPTGLALLDQVLDGGLAYGYLDILTGKRGDGKSTLGSMIVKSALENGQNVFLYSGEMRTGDVKKWLDRQIAGPEFVETATVRGYPRYELSKFNAERISGWYRGRAYIYDTGFVDREDGCADLLEITETCIRQYGCRVALIDNMMTAIDIAGENGTKFEQQELVAKALARMAQQYNALIILIAHKKKTDPKFQTDENDDVLGSSEITNLAGVIMSYERPKDRGRQDERLLKITKNRLTGRVNFEGIPCWYDEQSKRIGTDMDDRMARCGPFALEGFEEVDGLEIPF